MYNARAVRQMAFVKTICKTPERNNVILFTAYESVACLSMGDLPRNRWDLGKGMEAPKHYEQNANNMSTQYIT